MGHERVHEDRVMMTKEEEEEDLIVGSFWLFMSEKESISHFRPGDVIIIKLLSPAFYLFYSLRHGYDFRATQESWVQQHCVRLC